MRVLVCGGGFVGTYAALRLERRLRRPDDELVLVNAENYLQYQPFLPEAASGTIEPRHVLVALRRVLRRTRLIVGEVETIDHTTRRARVHLLEGSSVDLDYDVLVLAPGSVSRVLPVPALAELEDLSRAALKRYPELRGERARWVLIEATDRLLPEIDEGLAEYAERRLTRRGPRRSRGGGDPWPRSA